MKNAVLFVGMLLGVLATRAQTSLALTGGLHSATVTPNFLNYPDTVNRTPIHKARPFFGFVATVPIGERFFFRAGIQYAEKGSGWNQFYDTVDVYATGTKQVLSSRTELNVNYIDLPLDLMYKLPLKKKSRLVVGAGPQLSMLYTGNAQYFTTSVSQPADEVQYEYRQQEVNDLPIGHIAGRYRIVHLGANAFAGLEFNRVFLTMNYSRGLGAFYADEDRQYRHQTIGAGIGIFLGKQAPTTAKKQEAPVAPPPPPPPPRDSDGDGIIDEQDKCPQVAGLAKYDGCPIPDSDNDGINDEEDKCMDVYGLARYQGCPIPDSDNDGVNDEQDKCPQVAGTADNAGCPAVTEDVVKKVEYAAKNIYFDFKSARLSAPSHAPLDEVVKILKEDANLRLSIEGHTDNVGSDQYNQKMSEERAKAVKDYLESQGIDEARITAQGFGKSQPVADNSTPEGRAKNRRVVLVVHY